MALGAVVVVATGWAAVTHAMVQTPRVDGPGRVDAVLVLGGLGGDARSQAAMAMIEDHLTRNLVFSVPHGTSDHLAKQVCGAPPSGVTVRCFRPDPATTRGEAREIGQLAQANGWRSIAVVTSTYHISRSRLIVGRCFTGDIRMVNSAEAISVAEWAYQYLYQTLGYVKALVLSGC